MTKQDLSDNPYFQLPQGFDPSRYYGSKVWTDLTLQNASADPPRSIELIGLPGMGKSTLMRYLAHPKGALERNKSALLPPFSSEPSLMFMVSAEFRLLPMDKHPFIYLHERFFEAYKNYRQQHRNELKNLPHLPTSTDVLNADSASGAIAEALTTLKKFDVRVVFLLDDFHLAFAKLNFLQTTNLRPWRDRAALVMSTERRLNKVNAEAAGSPFFQTVLIVPFGGLTSAEARYLLHDPASRARWPFAPADIEYTLAQAGTYPHLLIGAGAVLWELRKKLAVPKGKKSAISKDHEQLLLGHFKERFLPIFQMYIKHLEPSERRALTALVNDEDLTEHYPALAYLEKLGLVQLDQVGYRPFSPLFGDYIKGAETLQPASPPQELAIPGIEGSLFQYLRLYPDKVHSFDELSENVWGTTASDGKNRELLERRVQVAISRLRKKLQESGAGDVINVRGKGYKLILDQS